MWKMTGLSARNFRLPGRGTLQVGAHADLTLFDAVSVRDSATYDAPTLLSQGVHSVIVNGVLTWSGGAHIGARSGQLIVRAAAELDGQVSNRRNRPG